MNSTLKFALEIIVVLAVFFGIQAWDEHNEQPHIIKVSQ